MVSSKALRNFSFFVETLGFFTSLPLSLIRFSSITPDLLFGRISFQDILPNSRTENQFHTLYIDQLKKQIIGFSHNFYNCIKNNYKTADDALNIPLSDIFKHFPVYLNGPYRDTAIDFPNINEVRFSLQEESWSNSLVNLKGAWTFSKSMVHWIADKEETSVFFKNNIDTHKYGLSFTLVTESESGTPASFYICSGHPDSQRYPDTRGYRFGMNPEKTHWVLKRRGYVVAAAIVDRCYDSYSITITIKKRTISIICNNNPVISYLDVDFQASENTYVGIALRQSESCGIKSCSLKSWDSPIEDLSDSDLIATFHPTPTEKVFRLQRFYNESLSNNPMYYNVAAYFLSDVTEMKEQFNALDVKYKFEAKRAKSLEKEVDRLEPIIRKTPFIGSGSKAQAIQTWAKQVAATDATVLIEGPTGSGKEVLAKTIHNLSKRFKGPFLKVDCASIPHSLLESQLFGHERGSFTGAESTHKGLLEQANGGIIFFDEIENMDKQTQAKLLQFLNDFTVRRIGGNVSVKLDVRCIAASNRNLKEMIAEKTFREDLFYRISVFQIALPSLNERKEDIPELLNHFREYFNLIYDKNVTKFLPEAVAKLERHNWQGNVREFRNCIERAILFAPGQEIEMELIQFDSYNNNLENKKTKFHKMKFRMNQTKPEFVKELLKKHDGHIAAAVSEIGASPGSFYYFLKKHDINPDSYRQGFEEKTK
ncbi:MAG: sigma-54-dependent Fis family transcriptional regulator [Fibrobacteres bacterium]|nr:sigma-54-dependent Fis family transcriptional regulator [Fibrobacterota bacterium]